MMKATCNSNAELIWRPSWPSTLHNPSWPTLSQQKTTDLGKDPESTYEGSKGSRIREIWPLMGLWLFTAIFCILYSIYIYKSLLSSNPEIGSLLPSASDTNLVVSILSQVLANLVDALLMGSFDVLRWQLAATCAGISATTFFQLSSATQWVPMFFLTITKLSSAGIGLMRYVGGCWCEFVLSTADN